MLWEIGAVSIDRGILKTGREDVVSVDPDTPVEEIARAMFDQSVGSVLVEDNGRPEESITDRDLVVELMTGNGAATVFEDASAAAELTAEDLMTPDPVTVDHEMEFPKVLRKMADAAARRVPITEDGDVVGIVTLEDCLVRTVRESEPVSAKLESLATSSEGNHPVGSCRMHPLIAKIPPMPTNCCS